MILLASSSKTRADILKKFGVKFKQKGCDFDEESIKETNPKSFVYAATMGKLNAFLSSYDGDLPVLCADTVVTCDGEILRKAKDKDDARRILNLQSENHVSIITCMAFKKEDLSLFDISSTVYKFAKFDKKRLEEYLNSDEWMGKAGACMVEGFCKEYILDVQGYESTAMGLCAEKLMPFLRS